MKVYFLFLLFLAGCISQTPDLSPIVGKPYHITLRAPGASSAGGIMFWGKSSSGESFGRVGTNNQAVVDLNKGTWTFYAMAWSTAKLKGDVSCAIDTRSYRKYGTEIVELALTNSKCTDSVFAGSDSRMVLDTAGVKSLGSTKITYCDDITSITNSSNICTDEPGNTTRTHKRGHAMSLQFSLVSYDAQGTSYNVLSDKVYSECVDAIPAAYTGDVIGEVPQLPAGKSGEELPFYVKLESFPGDQNCDSTYHGVRETEFKNGIAVSDNVTAKHTVESAVLPLPYKHKIYVKMGTAEICQGKSLTQDFGGGTTLSQQAPLLICNVSQLYTASMYVGSSFKLMNNIDLSPYAKGTLSHPSFASNNLACLGAGSNFLPIGMNNSCAGGASDFDFYGNDKTITGMKINIPASDSVGFISKKLNGSGSYWDLNFANARIIGLQNVGVAGGSFNSSAVTNITVTNSYVEALNFGAGGLMGEARGGAFKINVTKTKVVSASGNAGGIAGLSGTMAEVLFSGQVISTGPSVGGLTGEITTSAFVRFSRAEGLVQGASDVGGLVGLVSNSSFRVQNSYATVSVITTTTGVSGAGGLIGRLPAKTAASFLTNAYFFGSISHSCAAQDNTCMVGNIAGNAGGTWNSQGTDLYYVLPGVSGLQPNTLGETGYAASTFLSGNTFNFVDADTFSGISQISGDIPRLKFDRDRHPCRQDFLGGVSVLDQINIWTRGSVATFPIVLCNSNQVAEMQNHPNKVYQLLTYIYDFNAQITSPNTFSGEIDGDGYALMGKVIGDGVSYMSWWDKVTGNIKDLGFYSPYLRQAGGPPGPQEVVTQNNVGTLTNIEEIDVRYD